MTQLEEGIIWSLLSLPSVMYSKRKEKRGGGYWIEYKSNTGELVRKMTGYDDGGKCFTARSEGSEGGIG